MLTHERLLEVLSYDKETGAFTWLIQMSTRAKAGHRAGSISHGRRSIQIDGTRHLSNRLAWFYVNGTWPQGVVDHKSTVASDDTYDNLRDVTQRTNLENQQRAPSHNKSCGLLGVTWHKYSRKWMAQIKVNRKQIHIGYFDTPEAGHAAYVAKKREVHAGCLI